MDNRGSSICTLIWKTLNYRMTLIYVARLMQSSESDTTEDEFDLTYTPKSTRTSVTRKPKTQAEAVIMKEINRSRNNINNSSNVSEIRSPVTSKFTLKSPDFKSVDCTTPKMGTANSTPNIATTSSLLSTSASALSDTPVLTINRGNYCINDSLKRNCVREFSRGVMSTNN